jgi:hypothetical protein
MNNLEKICASQKLSKELCDLGFPQDTLFMWVKCELWKEPKIRFCDLASKFKADCLSGKREYAYAAPTCGELGEVLPVIVIKENGLPFEHNKKYILSINRFKKSKKWSISYVRRDSQDFFEETDKILANAMAKMLIYLLKNKFIKL